MALNGMPTTIHQMLPLLLFGDDQSDTKNFLLMTTVMQNDCNGQLNMLLPLLMMDSDRENRELIVFMAMMNNQNCTRVN